MSYFNNEDFQKGYAAYSPFLSKFRYSESKKFNKPFFVEAGADISEIKKSKSFALTSFGSDFAFAEALEIINQLSSVSDKVKSSWNKLESLLKKHDPYCQTILAAGSSMRKVFDKTIIYDTDKMFFAGRELFFIENLKLDGRILAFEPSSFVISQEIEEKETESQISIRKNMELNFTGKPKKIMIIDAGLKT